MDQHGLQAYVADPDNNLHQVVQRGDFAIELTYRPTDFLVLQELGGSVATEEVVDSLKQHYAQYHYFILSIATPNGEAVNQNIISRAQYAERIRALAFNLGKYVSCYTAENKRVPLADFAFPRMYGTTGKTSFLLALKREEIGSTDSFSIVVEDLGLGLPETRFAFVPSWLADIPRLDMPITQSQH